MTCGSYLKSIPKRIARLLFDLSISFRSPKCSTPTPYSLLPI
jgi:hypothetical protein